MKTTRISKGSRVVLVNEFDGRFEARLYVNNGESATLQSWKGKTIKGAEKWAASVLGN